MGALNSIVVDLDETPSHHWKPMSDQEISARTDRIGDDRVCDRCRNIPWATLGNVPDVENTVPFQPPTAVVHIPESRRALARSACRICRMLASAEQFSEHFCFYPSYSSPDSVMDRRTGRVKVIPIYDLLDHTLRRTPFDLCDDPVLLTIDFEEEKNSGCPRLLRLGKAAREYEQDITPIVPETADLTFARRYLTLCRSQQGSQHAQCTGLAKYGRWDEQRNNTLVPYPSRLRVIDCSSDQPYVIDALPEIEYVALSYVWGQSLASASTEPYSRVVMDAMKATRLMGFRYLWVDRHVRVFISYPILAITYDADLSPTVHRPK